MFDATIDTQSFRNLIFILKDNSRGQIFPDVPFYPIDTGCHLLNGSHNMLDSVRLRLNHQQFLGGRVVHNQIGQVSGTIQGEELLIQTQPRPLATTVIIEATIPTHGFQQSLEIQGRQLLAL